MNKSILLGLLLVPCFAYSMEAEKQGPIDKDGNDTWVIYRTKVQGTSDIISAYCKKNEDGEYKYSVYRQDRDGFSVDCGGNEQLIFENLQREYDLQQSLKR